MKYFRQIPSRGGLSINNCTQGQTIEEKIERLTTNKEPITGEAPLIYTERKDGVVPAYNIRTDRWDIAQEAMSITEKAKTAKREAYEAKMKVIRPDGGDDKIESIQGQTDSK